METPQPVDLNRLKGILSNAKKVMKVTDEKFPTKTTSKTTQEPVYEHTGPIYDETDEKEPIYENYSGNKHNSDGSYTEEQVLNSKLPQAIKEIMIKKPIPKINSLPQKFTLDELSDLVETPKKQKRIVNENTSNGDKITISISELNNLIDQRVNKILAEQLMKNISEQAVKKTITTLIREGKLTNKK
jgi:hypothetical protein